MAEPTYAELQQLYREAVGRADALYKSLFQNCHSVMLIICPETGAILDANEAACAYYGYPKSSLKQMAISQINTLSDREVSAQMRRASTEQNCFNFQHRLADGQIRDVEVFSGPTVYNNRAALYSIIYDITARKRMQAQIVLEKQFSDALINSLPGVMYLFDSDNNFVRWNRNFETVTGFTQEELKQIRPIDFVAPEDKEKVRHAIHEVYEKGASAVEAGIISKSAGSILHYLTGIRFDINNRTYLVGMGVDITERDKNEKEKQALIGQLQSALSEVKKLSGFLPICAACKKIRDDKGYWNQIEIYIRDHSEAEFSHSICPECVDRLYPSLKKKRQPINQEVANER